MKISSRFLRFLLVGGVCTGIDFLVFFALVEWLGITIIAANMVSYGTGLCMGFFLNRKWTFPDSAHRSPRRIVLVLCFGYVGLLLNTAILWAAAHVMTLFAAKCVAVIAVLFYNYTINRHVVFRVVDQREDDA